MPNEFLSPCHCLKGPKWSVLVSSASSFSTPTPDSTPAILELAKLNPSLGPSCCWTTLYSPRLQRATPRFLTVSPPLASLKSPFSCVFLWQHFSRTFSKTVSPPLNFLFPYANLFVFSFITFWYYVIYLLVWLFLNCLAQILTLTPKIVPGIW